MRIKCEKRIDELEVGDCLKRSDKCEYVTVQSEYYFDNSPEDIFVMFEGYSVPKKHLMNFFINNEHGHLFNYEA
jgi:hypothetical protein